MDEIVFVASPLRADTLKEMKANQAYARTFCRRIWEEKLEIGIGPHLYFTQFLDDRIPEEREAGLLGGQVMLRKMCEKMYVVGPRISDGMKAEIDIAKEMDIPIVYVEDPDEFFSEENGIDSQ